jgi:hypothetical protein
MAAYYMFAADDMERPVVEITGRVFSFRDGSRKAERAAFQAARKEAFKVLKQHPRFEIGIRYDGGSGGWPIWDWR